MIFCRRRAFGNITEYIAAYAVEEAAKT